MSNPIRLTGLASGMDTESMIQQLMKLETNKVDKQFQAATKLTYKVDAYKSVNSKLKDFRLKFATAVSGGMLNSNTYKSFNVSFKNNSNANGAVSISAGSSAVKGDYKVGVEQLATAGGIKGTDLGQSGLSVNSKLKDIDGLSFTKVRVADVQKRDEDGKLMFEEDGETPIMEAAYEERMELGIKVTGADGKETTRYYTAKADDTISTFVNRVNADKDTGVVMRYSQITGGFSFENRDTGAGQSFELLGSRIGTADDPYAWENMTDEQKAEMPHGFYNDQTGEGIVADGSALAAGADNFLSAAGLSGSTFEAGQNSKIWINGVMKESSKNTISLDGISITANDVTMKTVNGVEEVDKDGIKFNLSQDLDKPFNNIKEFVNSYNAMIEELNNLVNEKTYKDYAPLTDAQRKEMSETEQKEWDTKAKSGALRRDSGVQNLLTELRGMVYSKVEGTGLSLADIGITTSSDFASGGKLEINETKLKKALEEKPDTVMQMFTNKSTSANAATAKAENGFINRISNSLNGYVKNNEKNSLKMADEQQKKASDKWTELTNKLQEIEENYYKKFSAMETAMSKMQSQMNSLSGFFSS